MKTTWKVIYEDGTILEIRCEKYIEVLTYVQETNVKDQNFAIVECAE